MSPSKTFLSLFALLSALLLAASAGTARAGDCVDAFRAALQGRSLAEKDTLVRNLSAKAIRCLYEHASGEAIEPSFYLDEAHRAAGAVEAFVGKNSLPIASTFEKHFFSPVGSTVVYGYNEAAINHLLCSPGFFQIEPNGADRSRILFDYAKDLETLLKGIDLRRLRGAKVEAVKNNDGNLIFGGLTDVMKKIDADVAVGVALRKGKAQSYFVVARKP
ncbi:MAG: hypothetical protein JST04_06610 [Bdellovibrionales bacterium]|nr:hypothetical protein [Bdellovibrionales bacterium]